MSSVPDDRRGPVVVCDRAPLVTDVLVRGLELAGLAARAAPWGQPSAGAALVVLDADPPYEDVVAAAALLRPADEPLVLVTRRAGAVDDLARRLGAAGSVSRGQSLDELASAARLALAGRPLPRPVAAHADTVDDGLMNLTVREREVLAWLATGARNDAVAQRLRISPHTVRTHVQNVLVKLGVDNRIAAAAVARRSGLLPAGAGR